MWRIASWHVSAIFVFNILTNRLTMFMFISNAPHPTKARNGRHILNDDSSSAWRLKPPRSNPSSISL